MMKEMQGSSYLFGANAPFVEELYEAYLDDPETVAPEWRRYFDQLQQDEGGRDVAHAPVIESFIRLAKSKPEAAAGMAGTQAVTLEKKQVAVLQMINAYRFLGVRNADVDPLKQSDKPVIQELDPAFYGFTDGDMDQTFNSGSLVGPEQMTLRDILRAVRETYCGSIGAEYMYISDVQQKRWIQARLEGPRSQPNFPNDVKTHLLERVTAAETLEKYLHTRYVGQKRFSLEGRRAYKRR
jgi:2-oxoglutarate dehydrogenase E1 component